MDLDLAAALTMDLPFDLSRLPTEFPPVAEMKLRACADTEVTVWEN